VWLERLDPPDPMDPTDLVDLLENLEVTASRANRETLDPKDPRALWESLETLDHLDPPAPPASKAAQERRGLTVREVCPDLLDPLECRGQVDPWDPLDLLETGGPGEETDLTDQEDPVDPVETLAPKAPQAPVESPERQERTAQWETLDGLVCRACLDLRAPLESLEPGVLGDLPDPEEVMVPVDPWALTERPELRDLPGALALGDPLGKMEGGVLEERSAALVCPALLASLCTALL